VTDLIKVYTPIKRVPTMIGKAQNGQKLPFGPYTLPQVIGAVVLMVITSILAMTLPANPAITFIAGLVVTIMAVFGIGLVPYTGVRTTSRIMWFSRLLLIRKPVSASGMPLTPDSSDSATFIEETVVVVLPDRRESAGASRPVSTFVTGGGGAAGVLERWGGGIRALAEGGGKDALPEGAA